MYYFFNDVPLELINSSSKEGDVNILIGENGSGKSQLLSQLASRYIRNHKKVIAIANSVYDKFPRAGNGLYLLRDRGGRKRVRTSVKNALINISPEDFTRLKNAAEALRFVGYEPLIGVKNISVSVDQLEFALIERNTKMQTSDSDEEFLELIPNEGIEELKALLYKLQSFQQEKIIWLSFNDFSFHEVDKVTFIQLLKWERLLKRLKLVNSIDLYLRRENSEIPLYDASSGELSFISSLIYIATLIDENSAILVDEPENSLHPRWQKDYVKVLLSLFSYYQPKIVIATHSAVVVTGAEVFNPSTQVFKSKNFQFFKKDSDPINIEEAFYGYFDVITPQNRFLSKHLIDLLNRLAEGEETLDTITQKLAKIENDIYQPSQTNLIYGVREIAQKIINKPNNNNESTPLN
ncbi:AAA family ATPase [Polluticoccus soli]|uniref:AAA family ATPase n=1 Tax=Polluticoccus soli TaxID=3034150 RepID=UPI0023E287B3|nr:AAA family ATPase [Flavipsychrobacter sp. JY13-12]